MRKFSKILESAQSEEVLDIKDILMEFKDSGFEVKIDEAHGTYTISLSAKGTAESPSAKADMMQIIEMLSVADGRIKDLGMAYEAGELGISGSDSSNATIKIRYKKQEFAASKDVHGWKEFKTYCQNVLGIDGIEGDREGIYFRLNVVDKENGWPSLPDDMAGWSIEKGGYESKERFISHFPGYEAFMKKLLDRQIYYPYVWHICSDEGDQDDRISDPAKLEEAKKAHNPMKFDKEGIEAVETLVEMARKFPGKIEIKKHTI